MLARRAWWSSTQTRVDLESRHLRGHQRSHVLETPISRARSADASRMSSSTSSPLLVSTTKVSRFSQHSRLYRISGKLSASECRPEAHTSSNLAARMKIRPLPRGCGLELNPNIPATFLIVHSTIECGKHARQIRSRITAGNLRGPLRRFSLHPFPQQPQYERPTR